MWEGEEGGGGGREKDFFVLVSFFIRLSDTKTENKSFLVSFQHFCEKMQKRLSLSGLSKLDRRNKADAFVHHFLHFNI
jgi:hypothetical protein